MSYTVNDKLPEAFFVDTLTEKAEMLKKYLKDVGGHLVICTNIRPNMATFMFFVPQEEDSLKLLYFFEPRRSERTIILFIDTVKLCVEGEVNIIKEFKS